jgi:uncharacterized membrane protein
MRYLKLLLLLPLCLAAPGVKAEYFVIRDYQVNVTFTPEGYADFEEVIEVEFTQPRHGIFRFIPYRDMINNQRVDRIIRDIEVEGFKFSRSKENNNIVLKIGDADKYVDGRQIYRIRYRVLNPINFYEDHSEFYWDLLGINWTVNVESFGFRIDFPEGVNLIQSDVYAYTGKSGSRGQDVNVQVSPRQIRGNTTREFLPGESLTVATKISKGVFTPMSDWESFRAQHSLLFAPIIFLIAAFVARLFARNKRQSIMTEFFPPEGISPAIAGGFVDHSVDSNDVLSLIPHLANKGYLRMEAVEGKGFFAKDNIIFHKLKEAGADLMTFEKQFFDALFSYGDRVELNSLKERFYTHMASVRESVKGWISLQGWYEADQRKFGCLTAAVAAIALAWGAYAIFARQNMDGIALVATGFLLLYLSSKFNKRSPEGNQTYQKLEGFRQFVAKAERPVIEKLLKEDPNYYDKTMPYALAFGYLKQWNRQFDGLLTQPPSWYSGPGMYGANLTQSWNTFSESFPSEMNNIGSVFSSSPGGSSGGGGGGGGFSGGGSGGGGGGSW